MPLALMGIEGPIFVIGAFGPTLAALLLVAINEGSTGLKELLSRFLIWKVHINWYLFSIFGTALIALVAIGIYLLLGGQTLEFNDPSLWYLAIPVFFYVLVSSVLGEEIGWRGYALPKLLSCHKALTSSLLLGLLWGVWHLPLFWMKGNFHREIPFLLFLLQIIGFSILYT